MCTAYKLIHDIKVGSGDVEINGKLWDLKIPGKVGHFVWRLLRDRLLTGCNLKERQIGVENDNHLCHFCGKVEESSSHVFFLCARKYICYGVNAIIGLVSKLCYHCMQIRIYINMVISTLILYI